MGLEAATYVSDLVATNPLSTDKKKQGDDHLRLIKSALKTTFPSASKPYYLPTAVAKSGNYTVVQGDENTTFVCDTTTAFTLTLPTLVVGDAGWSIFVLKTTSDANPVFVMPPSGTINGYTKVRRSVPYVPTRVLWTGSAFVAERANRAPIGACLDFFGTALPPGHLWADNATIAAEFIELIAALGGTAKPDHRGRVAAGKDDMGGTSANRLTSPVNGDVLGATGGAESVAIAQANLPSVNFVVATNSTAAPFTQFGTSIVVSSGVGTQVLLNNVSGGLNVGNSVTIPVLAGTAASGGSGTPLVTLQPTIVANKILVAE